MEAEASELGDVIHDVVVLHVSENMLVEAPAVRVNEGRKQTGQSCYCKISCRELRDGGRSRQEQRDRPPSLNSRRYSKADCVDKKNGGAKQKAAVHIGPKA